MQDATLGTVRTGSRVATLSVALSVAVITIASSITTGFKSSVDERLRMIASDGIVSGYSSSSSSETLSVSEGFRDTLTSHHYISHVYPTTSVFATFADSSGSMGGVELLGVDSFFPSGELAQYIIEGEFSLAQSQGQSQGQSLAQSQGQSNNQTHTNGVIISEGLARKLGAKVGDKIEALLLSATPIKIPLTLQAIYTTHLGESQERVAFIPLSLANGLRGISPKKAEHYRIIASKGVTQDELLDRFEADFIDDPLILTTTKESHSVIYDWLGMLDGNMQLLLVIMLAVAGFNVAGAVLILILEKTHSIGVLKSMGMRNGALRTVFFRLSWRVSMQGVGYGLAAAGLLLTLQHFGALIKMDPGHYMVESLPVGVDVVEMVVLNGVLLGAVFLFTLIPSFVVGRISPAKTIKFS